MKNKFFTKTASYLIIGFALVALLSGSCKKGDGGDEEDQGDGNGYKISLKVDGVLWEFTNADFPPYGNFTDNGTQYSGAFVGTGQASSIGFQVYDTKAIAVNVNYDGFVITPTSGSNSLYGSVVSFADSQKSYSTQSITNPTVHVRFSEITSTSVRGEFSGKLKLQNGTTEVTVTEGKFYVRIGLN